MNPNKEDASLIEGTAVQPSAAMPEQPAVLRYAGFWMRFWAYAADLVIIGSLNRILVAPFFAAAGEPVMIGGFLSLETIIKGIIFYLYFVLMTRFFRQTLGKMIFGLKVISLKGERLTWGTLLFRECIGRFISRVTAVGYVLAGLLPKKQALHDIFADTAVIIERP